MTFYIFYRHRVCLVDHVNLIFSLYSCWEDFGSSSLDTLPWVSLMVLFPLLHVDGPLGLLLRLSWRTWVCPCEGHVWRWCSYLGRRGSGSTRYSGELASRAAGNIVLYKGMAASIGQYAPVFLPGESPSLIKKPGRPQSIGSQRAGHDRSDPVCIDA